MRTPVLSVVMFLAASVLGAAGQFLYKAGAEKAAGGAWTYLSNGRIWAGIVCYVGVMVLFVAGFKRGGQVQVLYPVYATTFIWAAIIAAVMNEGAPVRAVHVLGMGLLVAGMWLMGR